MLLMAQLSVGVRSEPDTGNRIRKGGERLPKARSDMPPSSGILKIRDLENPVPFDLGLFVAWLQRRRAGDLRLPPDAYRDA